jgi:hypothetical protein
MTRRFLALLSSKRFLLWLSGAWVFYYVTVAVWSEEAFAGFVTGLGDSGLFQSLYILFMASVLLNLIRAYRERPVWRRAAFVPRAVLPAGVLVFLLGFFLSMSFRQFEWILVGEGDVVKPAWQEEAFRVEEIKPALKDEMLDMEDLEFSIFSYEPRVVMKSGKGLFETGVFPPGRIGGSYYHVLNFGMAPGLRLRKGDKLLTEGNMALRILPPGVEGVFEIQPYPYRFTIKLMYEKIIEKGRARAKLYNLKSPLYKLTVEKGEEIIFRGNSDEEVNFDGLDLSFYGPDYWVMLEAASDPGLPVLVLGIGLITIGLPLHLLFAVQGILGARKEGLNSFGR